MKHLILIAGIILFNNGALQAQENKAGYFKNELTHFEFSAAGNGASNVFSVSWNRLHAVTKNKKFSVGYGLRFNSHFGTGNFITAPSKLTSGAENPFVIFYDDKPENFDTIGIDHFWVNSLNACIYLNYAFNSKWEIAFNIDAAGLSFGKSTTADYNSSKRNATSPMAENKQAARPSPFNLLLVSDNDIGSLNSEIKIKYYFRDQWALNVGGTFIFAEYTTGNKLFLNNDRFRQKSFIPMLGITYSPFRKTHHEK